MSGTTIPEELEKEFQEAYRNVKILDSRKRNSGVLMLPMVGYKIGEQYYVTCEGSIIARVKNAKDIAEMMEFIC